MYSREELDLYVHIKEKLKNNPNIINVVLQAITDGMVEKFEELNEARAKVETGFIAMFDMLNLKKKITEKNKSIIRDSLDYFKSYNMESAKKFIDNSEGQ